MTLLSAHWTLAFGLLGNIVSFMVFLAPIPTFYKVYKKKSTEGFQSVPYVVGLFSAMLWIYYAELKSDALLVITINSVGCFIQTIYICFFLFYAPKKAKECCILGGCCPVKLGTRGWAILNLKEIRFWRSSLSSPTSFLFGILIQTIKLLVGMNVAGFGVIIGLTQLVAKGAAARVVIVGWICLVFSLSVFVAPLCVVAWEGVGAVASARKLIGATNQAGTIRG